MRRALVALVGAILLAGCSTDNGTDVATPSLPATPSASAHPAPVTSADSPAAMSSPPSAARSPSDPQEDSENVVERVFGWLSKQPNWIWLLLVALVTHRLTLRREKWNREQARRSEQRNAIAAFSAAVNGAAPVAADLATWLHRHRTSVPGTSDSELSATKVDDLMGKFADKVFEIYRASDLLGMTLVDPELGYRATFAVTLAKDIAELGGNRERDPYAQQQSLKLLETRCTERMQRLLVATGDLLTAAMPRIQPQTSWWAQRIAGAHYRGRKDEVDEFVKQLRASSADIHEKTANDMRSNGVPASETAPPGNGRRARKLSRR